jgi:glyoxylase-like metal-dependent hydrolase (beta-lactamase superfamily II)
MPNPSLASAMAPQPGHQLPTRATTPPRPPRALKRTLRLVLAEALGFLAALLMLLASAAQAAAPMAKTNPPGFYRIMLGGFEVTSLSDGTVPSFSLQQLLTNTSPAVISDALQREFLRDPGEGSVNAFLINTGPRLVLVDVGAGVLFGPTLGRLLDSLRASGYGPDQVDDVILTHMHPDHVGGLMTSGRMAFPNATVHADRREAAFWLSQTNLDAAPASSKDFFRGAMGSVGPYQQAGRLKLFDDGAEITPGIRVRSTPGHTEGHTFVVIENEGRKLVLWGDLVHAAPVQFPHPDVTIAFDSDSKAAASQRAKAFQEAAREGYLVGAAHISFPGLGRVRAEGNGYRWVPLQYGVLR